MGSKDRFWPKDRLKNRRTDVMKENGSWRTHAAKPNHWFKPKPLHQDPPVPACGTVSLGPATQNHPQTARHAVPNIKFLVNSVNSRMARVQVARTTRLKATQKLEICYFCKSSLYSRDTAHNHLSHLFFTTRPIALCITTPLKMYAIIFNVPRLWLENETDSAGSKVCRWIISSNLLCLSFNLKLEIRDAGRGGTRGSDMRQKLMPVCPFSFSLIFLFNFDLLFECSLPLPSSGGVVDCSRPHSYSELWPFAIVVTSISV